MKTRKNKAVICYMMLYFMLLPCAYASPKENLVDEKINKYCDFQGISKDRKKDFSMLEEELDDTPNFKVMRKHLAFFVRIPKQTVDACPALREYLLELVEYINSPANINNKKISENTREIINYILQNELTN